MTPMPPARALDAIGQFVLDITGGHHGFGPGIVRLAESLIDLLSPFLQESLLAYRAFFSQELH